MLRTLYYKAKEDKEKYSAIIARYFLYGFGLLDSLILPKLLEAEVYSSYEYYKYSIFLFPNLLLGSYSGYMYVKYSKGYDLFNQLIVIGSIFSVAIAILGAIAFQNILLLLPILVMNLFILFEQGLKVQRRYIQAFLFKPLLSIVVLTYAVINIFIKPLEFEGDVLVFTVFILAFAIWFYRTKDLVPKNFKSYTTKISLQKYYYLISKIFTGTLASLVFGLMIFFERFFIDKFYPQVLLEYSFVFNMAQIMVIILSVFSYISSVEYGEKINSLTKKSLLSSFKRSLTFFILFYGVYLLGIYCISFFYQEFENLIWMTAILSISKGFFFFVGIYSPIAVYKNFNNSMLKAIICFFTLNIATDYLAFHYDATIWTILILNATFTFLYSFYILDIIIRRISYKSSVELA